MKLTKLQRHTAYILLYEKIRNVSAKDQDLGGAIIGTCYCFNKLMGTGYWTHDFIEMLPELFQKRTYNKHIWFRSKEERLNAIKQCISETY